MVVLVYPCTMFSSFILDCLYGLKVGPAHPSKQRQIRIKVTLAKGISDLQLINWYLYFKSGGGGDVVCGVVVVEEGGDVPVEVDGGDVAVVVDGDEWEVVDGDGGDDG
ncbi:hypothetical protein L1987_39071 [Smallanthus sonchifolius]|uniref:Uncharacterized protein n=1 Tax=Smallanthus sonchifolius TaxID=185202 RepID=A0ACB9HLP5_9ASTR|nr:hypothetical protein L1987_39071 [Smallanthus sonchifolius]